MATEAEIKAFDEAYAKWSAGRQVWELVLRAGLAGAALDQAEVLRGAARLDALHREFVAAVEPVARSLLSRRARSNSGEAREGDRGPDRECDC